METTEFSVIIVLSNKVSQVSLTWIGVIGAMEFKVPMK